jgi:DNA polymerase III subunit epsilon
VYAVIDLETTGLNPWRHDRIVEIAIVHVDDAGDITREWCTLVNPQRDLGPQRIHGIRSADARSAPTFTEVAPQIADLLRGRVLVAHNVAFDAPFLDHQFHQIGHSTPIRAARNLCTMLLAAEYLPESGRSLAACCVAAGIPLEHAHCALDDARASALLLGRYIRAGGTTPWSELSSTAAQARWPELPTADLAEVRRPDPGTPTEHFLARLVDALPRSGAAPQAETYLALLDRALVDRLISATESDALVALATTLHLDRPAVLELHTGYLEDLAWVALADGVLTDAEQADLASVAQLLGLPATAVTDALASATHAGPVPRQRRERWSLESGDIVVFTGETAEPRETWERRAVDAGLRVEDMVRRETRVVVAADIDTMSVKARKAHAYGIPVIDPTAFLLMVQAVTGVAP